MPSTFHLDDEATLLIHHYFSRICKIAGCFDSDLNPFRSLASSMMSYSRPVFLLLQASSAAHLCRQRPELKIKALSLQSEAFSAVRDDIAKIQGPTRSIVSDELMISSIIAGLTSAWYDVDDLGQSHVLGGQVLLYLWLKPQRNRLQYQQTFILGAFVYWLMISAFVVGDARGSFEYEDNLLNTVKDLEMSHDILDDTDVPEHLRMIIPHPLCGFSIKLLISIGKVGALCRMNQCRLQEPNDWEFGDSLEYKAEIVEKELLEHIQGHQNNFKDPEDTQTTIDEILSVGEAYRCAGLLQLYTTYPQLLQRQVQQASYVGAVSSEFSLESAMEAMILNSRGEFTLLQHNWLRLLASHICSILISIPTNSSTRVLQGLPVIIASTWLVNPMTSQTLDMAESYNAFEHPHLPLRSFSNTNEQWRDSVRYGLRLHGEYVGLEQVSRIIDIVEEIWQLDDEGGKKYDWMVVVASKGMQTLYG